MAKSEVKKTSKTNEGTKNKKVVKKSVEKDSTKVMKKETKKPVKKATKEEIKQEEKAQEIVKKVTKKNKTGLIIGITFGVVLVLVGVFLLWWFNRKFEITFKYNNGEEDIITKVKYLKYIDEKDVKSDLKLDGHAFVGYYETYLLTEEEISNLSEDETLLETTCKEGFKLNVEEAKCISEEKIDFKNTKIKDKKTIEAIWSAVNFSIDPTSKTIYIGGSFDISVSLSGTDDMTVTWSSDNSSVASVDENGKVKGNKEGKVIITAKSNGLERTCEVTVKKPEPKISLSTSRSCITDNQQVTITANITNGSSNGITWDFPECFTWQDNSDTAKTLARQKGRNSCSSTEMLNPTITAKLSTGQKASVSFKYEPTLSYTVYNNSSAITPQSGTYYGNNIRIETNVDSSFSGNYIKSTTSKSVTLNYTSDTEITIKTSCGQSTTVKVRAVIN